jgi:hypothetical protein
LPEAAADGCCLVFAVWTDYPGDMAHYGILLVNDLDLFAVEVGKANFDFESQFESQFGLLSGLTFPPRFL